MELVLIKHLLLTKPGVTNLPGTNSLHPHTKLMRNNMAFFFFFFFFLSFEEVPRLGVKLELQLPATATATATPDPSRVCDLHHSSRHRQILNPLSEARDQTRVLMDASL